MAGKLKPLEVDRETKPGKYADGGGLYLIVAGESSKNWSYRYWFAGKERWHGLGSFKDVSLKDARLARDAARLRVKGDRSTPGIDIVAEKRGVRQERHAPRGLSFRGIAQPVPSRSAGRSSTRGSKQACCSTRSTRIRSTERVAKDSAFATERGPPDAAPISQNHWRTVGAKQAAPTTPKPYPWGEANVTAGTSNLVLGADAAGTGQFLTGNLCLFGTWRNRILSASDVTALYNSGNGLSYAAMARCPR
jgi:Arm domain-containing DNA-binding protein